MIPPDLAAMLQGGGAPAPPEQQSSGGSPSEVLRQILQLCDQYRQVEQDDIDLLEIEKISTQVQNLLANQQKEQDDLLQGKASPRALRRNA